MSVFNAFVVDRNPKKSGSPKGFDVRAVLFQLTPHRFLPLIQAEEYLCQRSPTFAQVPHASSMGPQRKQHLQFVAAFVGKVPNPATFQVGKRSRLLSKGSKIPV